MDFIHNYAIEICIVFMIIGLLGAIGCIGGLIMLDIQGYRQRKKEELQKKLRWFYGLLLILMNMTTTKRAKVSDCVQSLQ